MKQAEAAQAVAYLNAAFPRDALEPESAAIWVREIATLGHAGSGIAAAQTIGRNGDRFPTIKEFRQAYRQAFDRFMAGREIEARDDSVPPPPEAVEMLSRMRLRSIDDLPETDKITPRPVWARYLRRTTFALGDSVPVLALPTDEEKHDAILVLAGAPLFPDELRREAQRIMDECS